MPRPMTADPPLTNREAHIAILVALIQTLGALSSLGAHLYQPNEQRWMALSLYDHVLKIHDTSQLDQQTDLFGSDLLEPYPTPDSDTTTKMKFIISVMNLLDFNDDLRTWILYQFIEAGDDIEDHLPPSLTVHRLDLSQSNFFRVIAHAAFALGAAQSKQGNFRHSYHMTLCSITIYNVVGRASPRGSVEKITDLCANLVFYKEIVEIASCMGEIDHALEYATKLVALHEIAVAESLEDCSNESICKEMDPLLDPPETTVKNIHSRKTSIDLSAHFDAQVLLADIAVKAEHYSTAVRSYTRALQLLDLQDTIANEYKLQPLSTDNVIEIQRRRRTKKDLCLKLVSANQECMGDALTSLLYCRIACELSSAETGSDSGISTDEADVQSVFLAGVLAYKYALQLAGGIEFASSPPVAIVVTSSAEKSVSIRLILDESIKYLHDALCNATLEVSDPNSKRSISLQLAILYTDIREEEKAHALLKKHAFTQAALLEIDTHRQRSNSVHTSEGYSPSLIAPFINVVYSHDVFKRLLSLAPASDSVNSVEKSLTLSSNRRSKIYGSSYVSTKTICTHCCMTFSSDDPIKCEDCATQQVYVYYCTEECQIENRSMHEQSCVNRQNSNSSEFSLTGMTETFSTLLNGGL
ncbi:hypothetical protein BDV3_004076 [Batrachochytrium dendrobatidis]|nr:hypothetical protein BDEG_22454 [Batrachochytrium dendrobatidis JEL423]